VMGEVAGFGCGVGGDSVLYVLPFSMEVKDSLLLFPWWDSAWGLFYAEIVGVYQGTGVCLVPSWYCSTMWEHSILLLVLM
jgi:hypothetical protein